MRPCVRRLLLPMLLAVTLAGGWGCNNNSDTATTPSAPTPFTVTETFTGVLTTNGAQSFPFSVQAAGTVSLTLTTVSDTVNSGNTPPVIGMSLGSWDGTSCDQHFGVFTDTASQGAAITGTASGAGTFCARVYDSGSRIGNSLAFTVTASHP